jgi:hypothetical protein
MTKEQIEQRFANAGWDLDGSFAEHLVIGYNGERISLLADKESWETDEASFQILDHDEMLSYWVHEVANTGSSRTAAPGAHKAPTGVGLEGLLLP